jgi:uncharacterized protein (DUF1778 family)
MDMKTDKMGRISVRIPADLRQKLETAAKIEGVSMTDIILDALWTAVNKQPETPAAIDVFS